jgi:hypothetical protein
MSVSPLVSQLGLVPHPEGGWYREIWCAPAAFTPDGYPGSRAAATAIYFLLHPGEESRWHAVRSDELWLWHQGGALILRLGGTGEGPQGTINELILGPADPSGPEGTAGAAPARLVPGGTWQSAAPTTTPTLVSCVVSPGFDFTDFRMAGD